MLKTLSYFVLVVLLFVTLSTPVFAGGLTPTLGDNSAYTLTEVSSAGADTISYKEYDSVSGTYVTKYYKITLKTDNLGQHLSWSEDSTGSTGSIVVALPNGTAKTYYYTYTTPNGYTETSTRLTSITADAVANKVFKGANSTSKGGAIYNTAYKPTINITSDFVGNYVKTTGNIYGGAIYNDYSLGNITGDFTGNYVYYTGSSSYYYSYGGAIYNTGTIGNITGDFTGNFVQTSATYGGAIYNTGKIGNIIGDFVGNYADSKYYYSYGGAIYNSRSSAVISSITGDFIGNYAKYTGSSSCDVYGGAIYNNSSAKITTLTGDFISNYVSSNSTSAYSDSRGGAIYNATTNGIGLVNNKFIGNYVYKAGGTNTAQGGAIYTSANLTLTADNGTTLFSGNYTQVGTGEKDYNAVYVGSLYATLTLNAVNNGVITFDDNIKGTSGYTLAITGDSTSTVNIHNTISDAKLTVSGVGKVDFVDNVTREYNLVSMTSDANTKYSIDIDLSNKASDKFITTSSSNGTVTLDKLNLVGGTFSDFVNDVNNVFQILVTPDSNLQLAISDSLQSELSGYVSSSYTRDDKDIVSSTVSSTKVLYQYNNATVQNTLGLVATDTANDSIGVVVNLLSGTRTQLDTLSELLQLVTTDERNFNVVDDYTVISDLGIASGGTVNINGNNHSIDLNNNSGIELSNSTTLNLKDVTVNNGTLANITNDSATINLENTTLNAVISGGCGSLTVKNSTLSNISNVSVSDVTVVSGTNNFNGTINADTLSIQNGTNTFNGDVTSSSALTITNGTNNFTAGLDIPSLTIKSGTNTFATALSLNSLGIENGTNTFNGDVTSSSALTITDGTNNFNGTINADTLSLQNGTNTFNGDVTSSSALTITDGTNNFNDTVNAGTLSLQNGKNTFNANITANIANISGGVNDFNSQFTNSDVTISGGDIHFKENTFANEGNTVNISGVNINLANGTTENYVINSLTSSSDVKYSIDVVLNGTGLADTISTTSNASGVITIDNIKFSGNITQDMTINILDTTSSDISIELADIYNGRNIFYYQGTKKVFDLSTNGKDLTFDFVSSEYSQFANGTISNIKQTSNSLLNNETNVYTLTEVTSDTVIPEGAVRVTVEGKEYYYTPIVSGALTAKDYQNLANTGHVALKELATSKGAIYQIGDKYYGYDSDKLPESGYTLSSATSSGDGVITKYEYDKDTNTLTAQYFDVNLSRTEYGEGGKTKLVTVNILGKDVDITVKYDVSTTKTYTNVYSSSISNSSTITIEDAIFKNVESTSGLIYNNKGTIASLTCDFISNSVTVKSSVYGGGVIGNYAYSYSSSSLIGDITGDFISNSVTLKSSVYGGGLIGNYSDIPSSSSSSSSYSSSSLIGDITGDFISNRTVYSSVYGGGLIGNYSYIPSSSYYYSYSSSSLIGDITGDFISNSVTVKSSVYGGGLIGNYSDISSSSSSSASSSSSSLIGDITGDFISNSVTINDNYVYGGGLIGNYSDSYYDYGYANTSISSIDAITGNFISNIVTGNYVYGGGLIGNFSPNPFSSSLIGDITGDFISNSVTVNNTLFGGGLIGNSTPSYASSSLIGDITGDFISNSVTVKSSLNGGGLIGNSSFSQSNYYYVSIGQINSNFYNNTLKLTSTSTQYVNGGGVIGNYGSTSTIKGITGEFVNNAVIKETGSATVYSGVIFNKGKITNGITNSTFTDNYVKISSGTVYGGAIYTTTNLSINAYNGTTLFSGNYTQVGTGAKDYNAIYVGSSSATLTLNAMNNGVITFNDSIKGTSGYTLAITGDSTSTVNIHNTISDANLTVSGVGKVDFVDNTAREYNLVSMTSDASTKYSIDVDLTNKTSDKFTVGSASSGTITLDNISMTGSITNQSADYKIQILSGSSGLQLALSDSLQSTLNATKYELSRVEKRSSTYTYDTISANTSWDTEYKKHQEVHDEVTYGKLGLATTTTTNDSLGINVSPIVIENSKDVASKWGDTLKLVNQDAMNATKTFSTTDATAVYTVTEDLGTTKGSLTVSGVTSETSQSSINLNSKQGFVLDNSSTALNFKDVTVGGQTTIITANTSKAKIGLNNVTLNGNVSGAGNSVSVAGTTTLNGTFTNTNTTVTDGTLKFNTDTFAESSNTLTVAGGNISLADGTANTYTINKLVSNGGTYSIDIDLTNKTSDKFTTTSTSSGKIYIDSINILDGTFDDFLTNVNNKIQIIKAVDSGLVLDINSDILNTHKLLVEDNNVQNTTSDTILADTSWSKEYQKTEITTNKKTYNVLSLTQTDTSNDSIGVVQKIVSTELSSVISKLGDTLKLVNQDAMNARKTFSTTDATAVYTVTENLGKTIGSLTVSGATSDTSQSSINLNSKQGFVLDNSSTALNFKDVTVGGQTTIITANTSKAKIGLNNVTLNGNVSGAGNSVSVAGTTTLNGTFTNTNTTVTDGTLKFNTDTFAESSNTLTVAGGNISLADGTANTYTINKLVSNGGTYSIDIDLTNKTSDKFTVGSASSGTITLDNISMTGSISNPSADYKIQILSGSSGIQLALSDSLQSKLNAKQYVLSRVEKRSSTYTYDTISANTSWDTEYKKYQEVHDEVTYGKLGLATTTTTNDSLGINVSPIVIENSKDVASKWGDTLKLVNQDTTNATKTFSTTNATSKYTVEENLGTTKGNLTVSGVTSGDDKSTIDLNGHEGFNLGEGAKLNLENIKLINGKTSGNTQGGAVRVKDVTANVTIENSVLSNNTATLSGGAFANINNGGAVSIVNSLFTANKTVGGNTYGGALTNNRSSRITSILNTSFEGNYVQGTNDAHGGAIYNSNSATIEKISGCTFSDNYAQGSNAQGGAIYNSNSATIQNISGCTFSDNYAKNGTSLGGAIYNNGTITNISANFDGNYVNSSNSKGGAIYNSGTITTIDASFTNNYAQGSNAKGGAIYTTNSITLVADNKKNTIKGNYITTDGITKDNQAIYVDNSGATLTLKATNNGVIQLEDNINGTSGYDVKLTGDGTGVVKVYNDIKNADVITDNVTVNTADGNIHEYTFNSLTSDASTKYVIDVNLANKTSDKFTVGGNSSGFITIDKLNTFNTTTEDYIIVKVLDSTTSNIKLALSGNITTAQDIHKTIADTVYNDTVTTQLAGAELVTTTTTNDSIKIYLKEKIFDTLATLNQKDTTNERNFIFRTSDDYRLIEDLGTTTLGTLNVKGLASKSTINLTEHEGFNLGAGATLNLENIKLINGKTSGNPQGGAVRVKDVTANVTIKNSILSNNTATLSGGAFANISNRGAVSIENSLFSANKTVGGHAYGGALTNNQSVSVISLIKDTYFTGNYVQGRGDAHGGAIYNANSATIQNISGCTFSDNYAKNGTSLGGAIYNNGTITNISANFDGNYVNSLNSKGGAIYNSGTITTIDASFTNNYAQGSNAKGGAIYTTNSITLVADNKINTIKGNYITTDGITKDNQAIYVDNSGATLTLKATNTGVIQLEDNINGTSGYDVKLTGDGTGVVKVYNDIKNADVITDNVTVNTADGNIHEYTFNSLTSDASTKYVIDVDLTGGKSDKFTVGSNSNGTITIDSLKFSGEIAGDFVIVQVLNSLDSTTSNIKLALSGNVTTAQDIHKTIADTVYDDTVTSQSAGAELVKTNTANDSIKIYSAKNFDTLATINQKDTTDTHEFIFKSATKYEVKEDLGTTKGSLTVSGVTSGTSQSRIDLNNKQGFVLDDSSTALNFKDVTVGGQTTLITANTSNAKIGLNNVTLNGNVSGAGNSVSVSGNTTLNGTFTNTKTTVTDGVLKFNTDTFAEANNTLTVSGGNINLADGEANTYTINKLVSNGGTYSIDVNLADGKSDKFTVGSNSNGTITIDSLKFSGEIVGDSVTVQVLDSATSDIQLALSSNIPKVDNIHKVIEDTVYNDTETKQEAGVELVKTNTENDSLTIHVEKIFDTLATLNKKVTNNERNFIFRTSDNYILIEDLGTTTSGTLNVQGLTDENGTSSIINFNNKSGFVLGNYATVLNINNTTLTNAKGTNGAVISANKSDAQINLNNTSLIQNSSSGKGGAIYSKADVNINADNTVVSISNNSDSTGNVAIYMDNADKTLTLNTTNNGVIQLNDKISGVTGYNVNITGDTTGTFYMYNDMNNANVSMGNVNLGVTNNIVHNYDFNSFNLTGNVKMIPDVDLVNKQMDRITANTYYVSEGATLTVTKLNLMNSTTAEKISIKFAESDLANSVRYTGSSKVLQSPIFNYTTSYQVDENGVGYFNFVRGSSSDSSSYNPSVLATSTAQQTGTYTTQLNTFNYAFQHAETFMNLPVFERIAYKNRNKYALSNAGVFSPLMTGFEDRGFWIKPYATFENIPLKNGPKVNSISYGTLVGYDELMVSLKHGWDRVFTYYLGYNGASQSYSGVDCYQNGGLLGATMTLYKGNFFTATTLSAGATVGEAHTMYGTEYATTMFAGIGNKTGYNIEFNQGRFIIQPSMLLAYTFLNTFDYKNAADVQINSDPTSMIQIAPTVRFVVNTKKGWQPYLAVGMVWNILAHSNIKANNEELPDMYTKPYVQYGLGLQRRCADRFTAFGQAMIYNGGRNGVSLTAGVRYSLGKDGHKHTSGTPKVVKEAQPKVVKELPKAAANSDTAQTTGDKKVASPKGVTKVKSDKNDKKITKQKLFDFKLQQSSIQVVK